MTARILFRITALILVGMAGPLPFSDAEDPPLPTARANAEKAHAFYMRGLARAKTEEWDKAVAEFRRALEIAPAFFDVYMELGEIYRSLERYSEAIEAYESVLRIRPKHVEAMVVLGLTYERMGWKIDYVANYEKAVKVYDLAAKIDPTNDSALPLLGSAHEALRNYDEALAAYEAYLNESVKAGLTNRTSDAFKKIDRIKKLMACDLRFDAPLNWEQARPMRTFEEIAQYRIQPRQSSYPIPSLTVHRPDSNGIWNFHSPQDCIDTWKEGFKPAKDYVRTDTFEVHGLVVTAFELRGKWVGRFGESFRPGAFQKDHILLGAFIEGPGGPWWMKAAGPSAAMNKTRQQFRDMLQTLRVQQH